MTFLLLGVLSAGLDWYSVWRGKKTLEYVFKPATMVALMLWFVTSIEFHPDVLSFGFFLGLLFSLGGDVFLMLPGNRFILGLISFLLAHIAYIAAFTSQGLEIQILSGILLIGIGGIAGLIFSRLRNGLLASGQSSLVLPVAAYVLIIALMVWSAVATNLNTEWHPMASVFSGIGAVFFLTSDALLGWNRFVRPIRYGDLLVIVTYHIAQFLMASGIMTQIGGTLL